MLVPDGKSVSAYSKTAIKSMSLVFLMILTVIVPMVNFHFNPTVSEDHAFTPQSFELGERIASNTGGRAPCPTNQYDGGTAGDADGSTSTTKTFGTNPSNQNVIGCIDAMDSSDFYSVTLAANKQLTVELTVPLGADYDLALAVQQGASTYTLISSQASDPLERIVFMGNNSTAGTYYVAITHFSGDGDYSLDMWTNSSIAPSLPPQLNEPGHQEGSIYTNTTLSTGWEHSCAVLDNGKISCWGKGMGSVVPSLISGLGQNITVSSISSGKDHTCVIVNNGSVACWGKGSSGQLGNGATSDKTAPTLTSSLGVGRTAIALSSGEKHTCAILDNGFVSCWGDGTQGRLGNGGTSSLSMPTLTSTLGVGRTAVAISSGVQHTCAILDNGSVSCWGSGSHGKLGNGGQLDKLTPTQISSLGVGRTAVAISSGNDHTCAILDNGSVSCWGLDGFGSLGNGGMSSYSPTLTSSLGNGRTAVAISSGYYHTCAVLDNGSVSCWGYGSGGILGNGWTSDRTIPTLTSSLGLGRSAIGISTGASLTCVILDNGSTSCWGENGWGQQGNGGGSDNLVPTLTNSLGVGRTVAISERDFDGDGILNIFDSDPYTSNANSSSLRNIPGFQEGSIYTNTTLSGGGYHTCAILDNDDMKCWGADNFGQLGDVGINTDINTPSSNAIDFGTGRTAVSVSSGRTHTCVILDNGDLKCWGRDRYGELGDGGTNTNTNAPPSVAIDLGPGRTAVAVSAGEHQTCAILDNGDLKCWGWDYFGQLGDGGSNIDTNAPSSTAIGLGTGRTAVTVSTGWKHTCAILDNGDLKCWGSDYYGQLGDGGNNINTNAPSSIAIDLGTGRTAVAVSLGISHTCAILDNGLLKCWGQDYNGQLGDGGNANDLNAPSPSAIDLGMGRTAVALSAGNYHNCAILDNGDLKCWGSDIFGQLGNGGSNTNTNAPSSEAIDLGTGRTAVAVSAGYDYTCAILDNSDLKCWGDNQNGQLGNGGTTIGAPSSTAINLGAGRTAALSERDFDGDGILNIFDNTPYPAIPDTDGDGWTDDVDSFPYDATQWQDSDGDGYGDNLTGNSPDVFPSEPSQWNDTDGDGYGDNQTGFEPDDCVSVWGNSTNGRFGCPDDDGDGLANIDDAFPDDPLRGGDADLDSYDDALDDDCPLIWGNSTIDRIGCIDTDGDGYSDGDLNWTVVNGSDAFPLEVSQWLDSDGDGYGDNSTGFEADQCRQVWGNSTIGQLGCPDNDGDGLSNTEDDCPDSNNSIGSTDTDGDGCLDGEDAFPDDSTEYEDSDGDGIGDNSDPEPGVPFDSDGDGYPDRPGYANSDDCPQISGNSTGELVGCLDTDGDGLADTIDAFPNDANRTTDDDLDVYDDLIEDDCVDEWGNSTIDLLGCLDSDGDGVSDINDLFPEDSTDWNDDDGDGVGNNSDVFPQDANETIDSDGDGVGDNSDIFPQDANETIDSDGDGIGDNEDQYPLQDNFIDTDNDGIFDVEDAFVTDPTQWQDADNDGYGDNLTGLLADLFPTDETQWFDLDGDGYGDNWGNATWNLTRLFIWPGMYIENASLADHCPDTLGNSSADGYFGCPDLDGDTIADIYDDEIDLGGENNQTQQITDTDNDGVTDLFDFCPNSLPGEIVDAEGCLVDQDRDGVGDSVDQCPNTPTDVEVNVEGCAISNGDESDTIIDELLAGDTDAIVRTVGIGAIIIAVIGFMQTNFIAAMLPDAFRWVQVFRKKSKLSAEEEMELGHLQSVVQAYFNDVDELKEELFNLKSDLTARFTNGEIKADTRKLIFTLIGDLLTMESAELKRIAHDDRFFGLAGTTDTKERLEMLEIEKAMRSFDDDSIDEEIESFGADFLDKNSPSPETKGIINEDDGHEYIEHPADSGRWFIRNTRTNMWNEWKD